MRTLLRAWRPGTLILLFVLVLAACGGQPTAGPGDGQPANPTVKIGSKNFTESLLVGEMYAQMLEANGFTVERKLNLGATPIAHTALTSGEIDLYPEYTSTGLLEVLKQEPIADAAGILAALREGYESQFQITWLEPAPFNNTNTFAMTEARAAELGVTSFSDLVPFSGELRLGGPPEFPEREDNKAVLALYGFDPKFGGDNYVQLDTGGLRYEALVRGDVEVVVAFGTDGQLAGLGLRPLVDDKNAYPIYQVSPVIRQATLEANPTIADLLNRLSASLTGEVMSGLNWEVDGPDKREVPDVVRDFLTSQGLI
ncbi:glycine betaine ABC transporter substrate-binding protein [Candidatus Chloroploca asiatica]|uniref:Quaternary ammonium transporter n=1 Tax=Candidatus Chloroploca asiatica TaxID=1506545 RepID=A0A2H3L123_9CHLR|nr:glycine betaine ABC transporter substrate-binding protein [Candidatus Chloroploca asiatica]PDV98357.1 quaternary ammonium transporter [Candidatus Chloroploca asiatica]